MGDWLLTVPLLLIEIILVMNLPKEEANSKCWSLGVFSALMILSGYKGELILSGDLSKCGVGLLIYQITINKSRNERAALESQIAEARIKIAVGKAETEQGCVPGQ